MIISHARRFVVYAPWKCASSTLHARLAPYNESPYDRFYDFNPLLNRVVHQHITCADFAALPESRAGYLTAAFVRNPYDRVYSGFRQIQRDLAEQPGMTYRQPWIRDLVLEQLSENAAQLARADHDFDTWVALLREAQVLEAGRNTSLPLHPAHYWTHHADRQAVDFIGRVEAFEQDFANLCERIGVATPGPIDDNRHGPLERAEHSPDSVYVGRMGARSLERIEELFWKDFAIFGYPRLSRREAASGAGTRTGQP